MADGTPKTAAGYCRPDDIFLTQYLRPTMPTVAAIIRRLKLDAGYDDLTLTIKSSRDDTTAHVLIPEGRWSGTFKVPPRLDQRTEDLVHAAWNEAKNYTSTVTFKEVSYLPALPTTHLQHVYTENEEITSGRPTEMITQPSMMSVVMGTDTLTQLRNTHNMFKQKKAVAVIPTSDPNFSVVVAPALGAVCKTTSTAVSSQEFLRNYNKVMAGFKAYALEDRAKIAARGRRDTKRPAQARRARTRSPASRRARPDSRSPRRSPDRSRSNRRSASSDVAKSSGTSKNNAKVARRAAPTKEPVKPEPSVMVPAMTAQGKASTSRDGEDIKAYAKIKKTESPPRSRSTSTESCSSRASSTSTSSTSSSSKASTKSSSESDSTSDDEENDQNRAKEVKGRKQEKPQKKSGSREETEVTSSTERCSKGSVKHTKSVHFKDAEPKPSTSRGDGPEQQLPTLQERIASLPKDKKARTHSQLIQFRRDLAEAMYCKARRRACLYKEAKRDDKIKRKQERILYTAGVKQAKNTPSFEKLTQLLNCAVSMTSADLGQVQHLHPAVFTAIANNNFKKFHIILPELMRVPHTFKNM